MARRRGFEYAGGILISLRPDAIRPVTWRAKLATAPPWVLTAYAALVAFVFYSSVYALRKPITAGYYPKAWYGGIELKTAVLLGQLAGYVASKYLGIVVCSQAPRNRLAFLLIGATATALASLLAFAICPPALMPLALFFNGLPLGITWGLMVRYLEGRRASDLILSVANMAMIVSTGVTKDTGRWLIESVEIGERWMPFATAALFLPLLAASLWALEQLPDPTERDVRERSNRAPMQPEDRARFLVLFGTGLISLAGVYAMLTVLRDFRDNYAIEMLHEAGADTAGGIFSQIEMLVAVGVLAVLGMLARVRDHHRALEIVYALMVMGIVGILAGTAAWRREWISTPAWLSIVGLGIYLAYIPFNAVLFERLIANVAFAGTSVFAIYVCDAAGYTASALVQVIRDLLFPESLRAESLAFLADAAGLIGLPLFAISWLVFRGTHRDG